MATVGSQFKIKQYDGFGGNFVDSDYLAASYDAGKPHVFQDTLAKIFTSSNRFGNKPILGMTMAKGKTIEIDDEIYRWYLQGAEEKALRVVENLEVNNATPGIGGATFKIKLDEDWFGSPEVIFGEDNDYPLQIVEGPIADGAGFIYVVRIEDDNLTKFYPPHLLEEGREFYKVWTSATSEFNSEYGGQQYPTSFMLESQVSAFAQSLTVTDKAWRKEGKIGIPFQHNGKKVEKFLPMAEAMMQEELMMSMEAQMMYGRKSTKPSEITKYWKKTGPGLRQQLADGHTEYYSGALTETRLKDYLMDIFFSRVKESDRKIVAMTGTEGSIMFHDLLAASARSFFTVDTNFITQIDKNPRHLSYGAQFTHYQGPEGMEVTIVKNPLYDDPKYSRKMHPIQTNRPLDSWRFTFLDFGSSDGVDNIQMLRVKDTFTYGHVPGTYTPTGPVKGGATNSMVAGYSHFTTGTAGIWVKDVTRCGELILEFED